MAQTKERLNKAELQCDRSPRVGVLFTRLSSNCGDCVKAQQYRCAVLHSKTNKVRAEHRQCSAVSSGGFCVNKQWAVALGQVGQHTGKSGVFGQLLLEPSIFASRCRRFVYARFARKSCQRSRNILGAKRASV